jgi:4a-hydroxytetrahydrobiopterin dehydratase
MSWVEENGTLLRTVRTPDFMTAFNIVSALVGPAEALNHHPDITFGWGYVRIAVTTHDAGGITELDHQLTRVIDLSLKPFGL